MNDNKRISPAGIKLIKEFEGYHTRLPNGNCRAYLDRLPNPDVWTIGYGCTKGVYEGLEWTEAQAEAALQEELRLSEANVKRLITRELTQFEFDALVSIDYNLKGGLNWTKTKTILRAVNQGTKQQAADAFLLYDGAGGKDIRGLARRRRAERELFLRPSVETKKEIKEVVSASSKLSLLRRARVFLGSIIPTGGFLEWLGYLEPVKTFATENWHFILLGSILVFYVISKWLEFKTVEDVKDGRYVPSGMVPETPEMPVEDMTKLDPENDVA